MEITLSKLRELGKTFDDASEGWTAKGTILEARTFKVEGRIFLALANKGEVRLKLERSLGAVTKLATQKPKVYELGGGGWVTIHLAEEVPAFDLMEKWARESHALVAANKPAPSKGKKKKR